MKSLNTSSTRSQRGRYNGYLAIERPDSPVLLVEPEVSLGGGGEVLVFLVRAAKTAAQAQRVVVGPPVQSFPPVTTNALALTYRVTNHVLYLGSID